MLNDEETEPELDLDAEFTEALNEPHAQGEFRERFIHSIIRAYPSEEMDSDRLNHAFRALFGQPRPKGARNRMVRKAEALEWMALEYMKERGGPAINPRGNPMAWLERKPKGARSQKQLAEQALQKVGPIMDAASLANEFSKQKRKLCLSSIFGSDVPSSLHYQTLKELATILKVQGMKLQIDI